MIQTKADRTVARRSVEAEPEETIPKASGSFKAVRLRLLMKEREDAGRRLAELDYTIWVLEEFFRTGSG